MSARFFREAVILFPDLKILLRTSLIVFAIGCCGTLGPARSPAARAGRFPLATPTGKCTLKAAQLPRVGELRGMYLGMTADEFKALFPKLKLKRADESGSTAVNIFPAFEPRVEAAQVKDVKTISLEFLDDRLSVLWIGYDSSFQWQTLEEFSAGMAAALKLPGGDVTWATAGPRAKYLECDDFSVTAQMIGPSPSVKLTDTVAQRTLEKRRAAK